MAFTAWQRNIVDETGAIIPNATIEVRNSSDNQLATIFADDAGTPKSNPFVAEVDGKAIFYAEPGIYDITATSGGFTATDVDVPLGSAQSKDFGTNPDELPTFEQAQNTIGSRVVEEVAGTSRIITDADNGKFLKFTSNDPITVTLSLSQDKFCFIQKVGTGVLTFQPGAGKALESVAGKLTLDAVNASAQATGSSPTTISLDINDATGSSISLDDLNDVDLSNLNPGDLLQYDGANFVVMTPTDGAVQVDQVLDGASGIGTALVVLQPGTTIEDEYNVQFAGFTEFPKTTLNGFPLIPSSGKALLGDFVEGVDVPAGSNIPLNLAQDVDGYYLEVTRETSGAPGVETGLQPDGVDYTLSLNTGPGGADQVIVNTVNAGDTFRVYATHADQIYNVDFKTWLEEKTPGSVNLWRIAGNYIKSGNQSGNVLRIRYWNPNPASSFERVKDISLPGGAAFVNASFDFLFVTIGDDLSIPGTVTVVNESFTVGTNITVGAPADLNTNIGDTFDPGYPVTVLKNGVTPAVEGVDYTLTRNDYPLADQITINNGGIGWAASDTVDISIDGTGNGYRFAISVEGGNTIEVSAAVSRLNGVRT